MLISVLRRFRALAPTDDRREPAVCFRRDGSMCDGHTHLEAGDICHPVSKVVEFERGDSQTVLITWAFKIYNFYTFGFLKTRNLKSESAVFKVF